MKKRWILVLLLGLCFPAFAHEETYIDGYLAIDIEVAQWNGMPAPSVSPSAASRIYHDSTSQTLKLSQNGGAYSDILTSAGAEAIYLRKDFENADSAPAGSGFYKVSDVETRLYVNGIHIHTWEVTGINFVFVDGNNFVFVDGNNFIFN